MKCNLAIASVFVLTGLAWSGQVFVPNQSGTASGTIDSGMRLTSVPFTLEAWVIPSHADEENNIFGVYSAASDNDVILAVQGGCARVFARNYNLSQSLVYSKQEVAVGRWSHIAMTCDGSEIKLYVNGVLGGTLPHTNLGAWTPTKVNLCLAGVKAGTSFCGKVCDMRYWTVVRTEAEIAHDMGRRLRGNEQGLAGYWPLTETSGTSAANLVAGTPSGICAGGGWESVEDHPFPSEDYDYAPNDDYVQNVSGRSLAILDTRLLPDADKPFTFEVWACPTNVVNEGVALGLYAQDRDGAFVINTSGGRAHLWIRESVARGTSYNLTSATTLTAGKWYHVAGTYDLNKMKLYVNGGLEAEQEISSGLKILQANHLVLGGSMFGTMPFRGALREAQYWDVARTAEQIASDMCVRPKGDEAGLIGYWPLNESRGNYARNLGFSGVAAYSVSGPFAEHRNPYHSYELSDKVYVSATGAGTVMSGTRIKTTAFTLEAWVRPDDVGAGENIIMGQYNVGGGQAGDLVFKLDAGRPWLFLRYFGTLGAVSGDSISAKKWSHVAVTCDGTVVKIFVNGKLKVTKTSGNPSAAQPPVDRELALSGLSASNCFRGQMSDVRVWSVVRSEEDIASSFRQRLVGDENGLLGYWPMDGGGNSEFVESIAIPRYLQTSITGEWTTPDRPFPFGPLGFLSVLK